MSASSLEKTHRIQRRRIKGWKMPPNTIYVGSHIPTQFGFTYPLDSRVDALNRFRSMILSSEYYKAFAYQQLRGKNLACWCPLDQACHADVLLEIANG